MKRQDANTMDYYGSEVVRLIIDKYGYDFSTALREFIFSKTHGMLEDEEYGLTSYGAGAIFDLWEAEKVTGDPRNSVYIREE